MNCRRIHSGRHRVPAAVLFPGRAINGFKSKTEELLFTRLRQSYRVMISVWQQFLITFAGIRIKMNLFYIPGKDLKQAFDHGDLLHELPADEVAHLRVMRLKPGDLCLVTDGIGNFAAAILQEISGKRCIVNLQNVTSVESVNFRILMAVAPTKNIARYEWFIEKATELGVDEIFPLWCDHSERAKLRIDRLQKVAAAAMKQSQKARMPLVHEPQILGKLLQSGLANGNRFIAWIDESVQVHLKDACQPARDTLILIGPEGDFSKAEVNEALRKGFQPVSLGKARLRTETAAVAACHIANLVNT